MCQRHGSGIMTIRNIGLVNVCSSAFSPTMIVSDPSSPISSQAWSTGVEEELWVVLLSIYLYSQSEIILGGGQPNAAATMQNRSIFAEPPFGGLYWPWLLACVVGAVLLVKLLRIGSRPKDYPPGTMRSQMKDHH